MSLFDDLLAEKNNQSQIIKPIIKPIALKKIDNVQIILENPDNDVIKNMIQVNGKISGGSTTMNNYTNSIINKKIATILNKYGKLEL